MRVDPDESKTLQEILQNLELPQNLPIGLPVAHLSLAGQFSTIVKSRKLEPGKLKPGIHKSFDGILYLSYGGIFHRPENCLIRFFEGQDVENRTKRGRLPIAFLFSPGLLRQVSCYYPYDTGAVAKEKYGYHNAELAIFNRYKVLGGDRKSTTLRKLIYYLYGSSRRYLNGYPEPKSSKLPFPFPKIYNFLMTNLTSEGVDQRQLMIECHVTKDVPIGRKLLWVAFPQGEEDTYSELCKILGKQEIVDNLTTPYAYPYHTCANPNSIADDLMKKAKEAFIERYLQMEELL